MTFKPAPDLTILAPAGSGDWRQEWAEGEVIRRPDRVILRTNGQGQALRAGVELRPALHLGQQNLVIPLRVDCLAALQRLELRLAAQDYGWELGAHHSQPLTTMAPADLAGELGHTLEVFQTQGWAQGPVHFAYPLGRDRPWVWSNPADSPQGQVNSRPTPK